MFALSGRCTGCVHAARRFRGAGDSVWAVRACDAAAVQTPAQRLRGAGEGARLRLLHDVRPGRGTSMWSVHREVRLWPELPAPTWGKQTTTGATGGTGAVLSSRFQKTQQYSHPGSKTRKHWKSNWRQFSQCHCLHDCAAQLGERWS